MTQILTRKDVPTERIWKVSDILDEKNIDKMISDVKIGIKKITSFSGKISQSNALECLLLNSRTSLILEKLYVYANLKWDEDKSDTHYMSISEKISMLSTEFSAATSFIVPAFSAMKKSVLLTMKNNSEYRYFSMFFDEIIRLKKHLLSEKEEKILAELTSFSGDFQTIFSQFDNVNVPFGEIEYQGEKVKLSHGLYSVCLQSADRNIRKKAYETMYAAYISMIDTVSSAYVGSVKKDCFSAKVRKYKSSLEQELFSDNIPVKVYDNLISCVHKYIPVLHKYMDYRKKELRLSRLAMYDLHVPIVDGIESVTDYDEAYKTVCEALKPLGKDYIDMLHEAKKGGWIDVEETKNKRSGAYSWGVYGTHPYVLLNHKGTIHDTFTIAHEIGHAMHTYYSNQRQCYEKSQYSIFVAEIASTVNEVLMIKHLLRTAEGKERKYLLSYYADMIRTTLFRQTMFSEFEKYSHDTIEKGEPLGYEEMCKYYSQLNQTYYGDSVETDDKIAYEWVRIPHFYNAFYVYKYATGITCAINIANGILDEKPGYCEKYKEFLSMGGSLYPLDILKIVDIDLTKRAPYDIAMKEFDNIVKELKKIK